MKKTLATVAVGLVTMLALSACSTPTDMPTAIQPAVPTTSKWTAPPATPVPTDAYKWPEGTAASAPPVSESLTPQDDSDASESETEPTGDSEVSAPLQLKELGWGPAGDNDWVMWGAVVHNPGSDLSMVDFTATALDAAGDAVSTDQQTLFRVPGGESIVVGGTFSEGHGTKKVELDISNTGRLYSEDSPAITGTLKAKLKLSGSGYDGQISAQVTSTLPVDTQDALPVFIIFRDSAGKISGGDQGFTPGVIRAGTTRAISLTNTFRLMPDHYKTAEVYFDVSNNYLNVT